MAKHKSEIPTLEMASLDKFHFGNLSWPFSRQHELFHINRLEEARERLLFPLPPHRKTVYDLLFITRGKSLRSKGLNEYSFGKNQFFFLPALQITAHQYMSEDIEGFFLHFSPNLFSNAAHFLHPFSFLQFNTPPIVYIPDDHLRPILNIFERLLKLYKEKEPKEPNLIRWYLLALFSEAQQHADHQEEEKKDTAALLTQQYKDALTQHIYQYRNVRDYAQMLHRTPNHLNKCVKKTLNKTAQFLLNEMLVLEAQSLLKYSELSISQIAERLCGSTPSNFSRFFKKQTGISPKDYLKQ